MTADQSVRDRAVEAMLSVVPSGMAGMSTDGWTDEEAEAYSVKRWTEGRQDAYLVRLRRYADALAAAGLLCEIEWEPAGWWRSVEPDGSLWGEASDEEEIRRLALDRHTIQQLWRNVEITRWRDA